MTMTMKTQEWTLTTQQKLAAADVQNVQFLAEITSKAFISQTRWQVNDTFVSEISTLLQLVQASKHYPVPVEQRTTTLLRRILLFWGPERLLHDVRAGNVPTSIQLNVSF